VANQAKEVAPAAGRGHDRHAIDNEVFDGWNEMAREAGLPLAVKLSLVRAKAIRRNAADAFWLQNWRKALQAISESSFCRGEVGDGWRATFDWFLKAETVLNSIEGKYANRNRPAARKIDPTPDELAHQRKKLKED
jgi:hypothetical protein